MSNFKSHILETGYGSFYPVARPSTEYRPKSQCQSKRPRYWKITDDDMTKPLKIKPKLRKVQKSLRSGCIENPGDSWNGRGNNEITSTYSRDYNRYASKEKKGSFNNLCKSENFSGLNKYKSMNDYLKIRSKPSPPFPRKTEEYKLGLNEYITDRFNCVSPTSQLFNKETVDDIPYYEPSPEELAEIESALYESISEKEPQILEYLKDNFKDKNIDIESFVENNSEYLAHAIGFCACARCECGCCHCGFVKRSSFGNLKLSSTGKSHYNRTYVPKSNNRDYDLECPASVHAMPYQNKKKQMHHQTTTQSDYIQKEIDPEAYNKKKRLYKKSNEPLYSLTTYNNEFKNWKGEKRELLKRSMSQKDLPITLKLSAKTTYGESFIEHGKTSAINIKRPNM